MKLVITILLSVLFVLNGEYLYAQKPYNVPSMQEGVPAPGKRIKVVPEGYENTNVYHSLYLPEGYSLDKKYPIILEYTGNYAPNLGSTGEVKDAGLGFELAKDLDAIWVVMPYLSEDAMNSEITWWGSEEKTIDYCAKEIKEICLEYGGDPSSVFIIGFSRGAIAVNRIGLNDDRAADIWLGFYSHDHFDGHIRWCTDWANNCDYEAYKADAIERAIRYRGRAALVGGQNIDSVVNYISVTGIDTMAKMTFLSVPIGQIIPEDELFVNPVTGKKVTHTDKWMNYDSPESDSVINWYKNVIREKPGTYAISGTVSDKQGNSLPGLIVETGLQGIDSKATCTHFAITDSAGKYELKGIIPGERFLRVTQKKLRNTVLYTQKITLHKNSEADIRIDMSKKISENVTSIDIILLMGQSNMVGAGKDKLPPQKIVSPRILNMNKIDDRWYPAIHPLHTDGVPDLIEGSGRAGVGPGLDFAKVIIEKDSTTCVALIPCARGGTWIDLWMPGTPEYNKTIRRAKKALADFSNEGISVNIKAALWLQGESDAKEGRYQMYESKLKVLVDNLRSDLDLPELPFISATIGSFIEEISYKYPYSKEINETLLNAGSLVDNYSCVDVRDLTGHLGDYLHYNATSQQEIGKRMAEAFLEMTME